MGVLLAAATHRARFYNRDNVGVGVPVGNSLFQLFGDLNVTSSRVVDFQEGRATENRGSFMTGYSNQVLEGQGVRVDQIFHQDETWWIVDGITPDPRYSTMEVHLAKQGWSFNKVTD